MKLSELEQVVYEQKETLLQTNMSLQRKALETLPV